MLIATVEDGRLLSLRPDDDHPLSRGRACPKGIAFAEVQNDPDRVLHPLRRRPDGELRAGRLGRARSTTSPRGCAASATSTAATSIGQYFGNPTAFAYATGCGRGCS